MLRQAKLPLTLLYERIVHDFPIDTVASPPEGLDAIFVGGDREEIVRVSSAAVAALEFWEALPLIQTAGVPATGVL